MRNRFLALLVAVLSTTGASAQGWAQKMFTGGLSHDFGTVARGAQLVHQFTMTNIYAVQMEIVSIKSGCGCVSATAAKRILEPRESTTIEVRMDAHRFVGPKSVGVRVDVGPNFVSGAELRVSANSRSDVVFNPGEVNFGPVMSGQTPTQVIDVEYAGALPWAVSEVVARDLPFDVTIAELYRRPGQVGYRLKVTLKAGAPVGPFKHDVNLRTNDPATPLVGVLVEGNVQSTVQVTPPALNLGAVKADTPLVRRVVIRGGRPFHVTGVEGTGAGIELAAPPGGADAPVQTVTFNCQFTAPGDFRRELKIRTTLQDAPVTVTIDGTVQK